MKIGQRDFDFANKTYCMGILNVTPDSFSDGGRFIDKKLALDCVARMVLDGADIIDVGGESTRPGYTPISEEEELRRVLPVISDIRKRFDIPISIDTHKASVAQAAIYEGADMINDVYGSVFDEKMPSVAAKSQKPFVLSHGYTPGFMTGAKADSPKEALRLMAKDFESIIDGIKKEGVKTEQLILDPGVGFLKGTATDLAIMANLKIFCQMGYPIMLGASRKSVIGNTLRLPVGDRLEGSITTTAIAVLNGVSIVRVHDVEEHVRVIKMAEAIREYV